MVPWSKRAHKRAYTVCSSCSWGWFWDDQLRDTGKTCWNCGAVIEQKSEQKTQQRTPKTSNMVNQLKKMVLSPDTPSLCKPQLQTVLAQISSETIKDVPIDTRVGQASQKVARLKKEYANVVNSQYNAERLVRDTKEKAIRIADQVDQAEKELNELCAMKAAAEDSKDRTPRIDLAQLLEPDAASRIIIDDIGIIGDESDLDLTDEERMAYQSQKKLFAAELTAAVQSHWGTLRQVVEAKRAEARETQKQWIKKRKVETVVIGSRMGDTPDVSELGDALEVTPATEQQVLQEKELLAESIKDEARRRRNAKNHP